MYRRILIPVDFTELSEAAYEMARRFSEKEPAEISLIHVIPTPFTIQVEPKVVLPEEEMVDLSRFRQEEQRARQQMDHFIQGKKDVRISKIVMGNVTDEILRFTNDENIDLLIVGSRGSAGLSEFMIGSQAEKIVRQVTVPVITLKQISTKDVVSKILFVSDFEFSNSIELRPLIKLAQTHDAKIIFLRINTPNKFKTHAEIKKKITDICHTHGLDMHKVSWHIYCDHSIAHGITHFGEENGVDFVVLATNQHKGLSRIFKENISYDLVNHLSLPLMTFPVK